MPTEILLLRQRHTCAYIDEIEVVAAADAVVILNIVVRRYQYA